MRTKGSGSSGWDLSPAAPSPLPDLQMSSFVQKGKRKERKKERRGWERGEKEKGNMGRKFSWGRGTGTQVIAAYTGRSWEQGTL